MYPGRDGHTRVAKDACGVKTAVRPINKLIRWPLGRIVEVYPGRDGHTRVAKDGCGVKTAVRPLIN